MALMLSSSRHAIGSAGPDHRSINMENASVLRDGLVSCAPGGTGVMIGPRLNLIAG